MHLDRHADHRWFYFDRKWQRLCESGGGAADVAPPLRLQEMLEAAELIAGDRDHLRVDFYEVESRLWFGELCLFPGSGLDPFNLVSLDESFGRFWTEAVEQRRPAESLNVERHFPSIGHIERPPVDPLLAGSIVKAAAASADPRVADDRTR